ncbi:hypothetical protein ACTDI4_11785 [Mesorhizobium sp. PUT5]|uniref:hypothetical protein n=1 Tax=Mesorhizobium sp. PUT5 TaxID=3454629 RepID=UPI003FA43ED5
MTYNLPAIRWLAKQDPEAALAVLQRIRDENCSYGAEKTPAYLDPRDRSADDTESHVVPDHPLTSETMAEPVQDGPDEIWPEMLHEVKPDIHSMLRSAGGFAWPWCGERWRNKRTGKVSRSGGPWAYTYSRTPHAAAPHIVTLGGLTFYTRQGARRGADGGMLVSYVDDAGNVRFPTYKANKPRGGRRPYRLDAAGYLALKPTTPSPLHAESYQRPLSGEPALAPMYGPLGGVEANRDTLRAFGVDGSVSFERLHFPATKCPTVIAKGARFIAGISGRSQTASPAVIGKVEEPPKLDTRHAAVIEEVASRGKLASIGRRLGYRGGYADRAGGKALLDAGKAVLAANDNNLKKAAA